MKNLARAAKSPLSIAVIGAGKIGSTFAYQLARVGHDVTVVARPDSLRLQQLQRDHGIILKTGERAEVRLADKLDEEAAYNLVVVTTPAHQVDAVLPMNDPAYSFREALFAEVIVGVDPDPANAGKITEWCKTYYDALHPYSAGGYVNFMMDEG